MSLIDRLIPSGPGRDRFVAWSEQTRWRLANGDACVYTLHNRPCPHAHHAVTSAPTAASLLDHTFLVRRGPLLGLVSMPYHMSVEDLAETEMFAAVHGLGVTVAADAGWWADGTWLVTFTRNRDAGLHALALGPGEVDVLSMVADRREAVGDCAGELDDLVADVRAGRTPATATPAGLIEHLYRHYGSDLASFYAWVLDIDWYAPDDDV